MIFPKKLQNAVRTVKEALRSEELYSEDRQVEQEKLDALMDIVNFVKRKEYINSSMVAERFSFFLSSGYDYKKTASKFGIEKNAVEVMVSRVSRDLEQLAGKETIEMILDGRVSEAIKLFRAGTMVEPALGYFLPEVVKHLPEPKLELFTSLEECRKELNILGLLTKHGVSQFIESCSQEKLAHILYLLTRDKKRLSAETESNTILQSYFENGHSNLKSMTDEREVLTRLFSGEFSTTDDGQTVKMNNQVEKVIQLLQSENLFHDMRIDPEYTGEEE